MNNNMSNKEQRPFGAMIAELAEKLSGAFTAHVDMDRLAEDREYIIQLQADFLTPVVVEYAKEIDQDDIINQIYFQITPDATPQLSLEEFCAGVCIENIGKWHIREHNLTHIKDIVEENVFFKWWYFETIRMNVSGWTRVYYDPYLKRDVVTYSTPVYGNNSMFMGVLGIDLDYSDFKNRINKRLVENIKMDIETLKKEHESIGEKDIMAHQYLDVNTYEFINNESMAESIGMHSAGMRDVMELAKRAVISDANVLLMGETGCGKDFLAKSIHRNSRFSGGAFINVNCCALAENLIESELFGYGKGAFTGAKAGGNAGYFEVADQGTIVLNEIGDLPLHLQAKLLNIIQDKEVMRIGETTKRKTNFRLIAATNKDLAELVQQGKFREDLFYRINVLPIRIPPLRERKEDIFPLINLFLQRNLEKYRVSIKLSVELVNALTAYSWPGNIRELENFMERLVLTSTREAIELSDLPKDFLLKLQEGGGGIKGTVTAEKPAESSLKETRESAEAELFREKYRELGSSYKVAEALGISQSQAYKKIKKYVSM